MCWLSATPLSSANLHYSYQFSLASYASHEWSFWEVTWTIGAGLDGEQASEFESMPLPPTVVEGNQQSHDHEHHELKVLQVHKSHSPRGHNHTLKRIDR